MATKGVKLCFQPRIVELSQSGTESFSLQRLAMAKLPDRWPSPNVKPSKAVRAFWTAAFAHQNRHLDGIHPLEAAAPSPCGVEASIYVPSARRTSILAAHGKVAERRRQRRHPVYQKPELLAEGPNEVWSWDITKLMGPVKWSYFYLYVILDIGRRRVVGWRIEPAESAIQFKAPRHCS